MPSSSQASFNPVVENFTTELVFTSVDELLGGLRKMRNALISSPLVDLSTDVISDVEKSCLSVIEGLSQIPSNRQDEVLAAVLDAGGWTGMKVASEVAKLGSASLAIHAATVGIISGLWALDKSAAEAGNLFKEFVQKGGLANSSDAMGLHLVSSAMYLGQLRRTRGGRETQVIHWSNILNEVKYGITLLREVAENPRQILEPLKSLDYLVSGMLENVRSGAEELGLELPRSSWPSRAIAIRGIPELL